MSFSGSNGVRKVSKMETKRFQNPDGSWTIDATIRAETWSCTLPLAKEAEEEAKHLERTLHIDRLKYGDVALMANLSDIWKQVISTKVNDGL